jgi:ATP-binding cassette subfamily B protein/ATP-binding cassette subfamily C protein LapB
MKFSSLKAGRNPTPGPEVHISPKLIRGLVRQAAPVLLGGLGLNLLALCMPIYTMLIYDKVVGNEVHETLWALSAGLLLVMMLEFTLRLSRAYVLEYSTSQWDRSLDRRITLGVLSHPLDQSLSVGALFGNLRELSSRRDLLSAAALIPLMDLPFLVIYLISIALLSGQMVLIPVFLGSCILAVQIFLDYGVRHFSNRAIKYQKEKIDTWHELVVTRTTLAGSDRVDGLTRKIGNHSALTSRASARQQFWMQMMASIVPAASSATTIMIMVWGVFRIESQEMSTGQLIAVSILATRAVGTFMSIQPIWMRFRELREAMRELARLISLEGAPPESIDRRRIACAPAISVTTLSYTYPEAELPTLSGISLTITPGQLVVVVGKVGCGKSSLIRLLAGHFLATDGVLAVGDLTVSSMSHARQLQQEVAYLEQSPVLLRLSVEDYLLGEHLTSQAKDAALAILRELQLDEALRDCGLAMNSEIDFAGGNLSGGQRRMLAVARALCMNRFLILLDEPTAGLDADAEKAVLRAIQRMRGKVTMVVASHSADLVSNADRILVLERGRQIGWGTPRSSGGGAAVPAIGVTV